MMDCFEPIAEEWRRASTVTDLIKVAGHIPHLLAQLSYQARTLARVKDTLDSLAGVKDPEFIRSQLYKALEGSE